MFGGCLRFLPGVWHLDLDLDITNDLWYSPVPNFGYLFWIWRRKNHSCSLSPHLGLWRLLELPGWDLVYFVILILIWIRSQVYDILNIISFVLYLDSEGAKNIHVLQILIWSFGRCWMFLTWVWHLDLDFDMATGLWYTQLLSFGSLSWFWRCKEHPCFLSSDLVLWMMLDVPDLGLAS